MLLRKITIIKLTLVLLVSINLVHHINKQKEIRKKYISYTSQEFDKELKIRKFTFQQEFIKPLKDIKDQEELVKMEKQQAAEKKSLSRGGNIQEETFILTFYTSLIEENSDAGPVTCNGSKLREGIVANNVLPQGTKISTKEYGELIVADRGGGNFDVRHRLDVFVSRKGGESDYQYKRRVNSMGKVKVTGYIVK